MVKILLTGNVKGNFDTVLNKVTKINKAKGSFDVLFCVGQFFDDNNISCMKSFVDGTSQWPIETYVVLGSDQLSTEDLETVSKIKNLHFISKPEMRVIHDLSIVFVPGVYEKEIYESDQPSMNHYTSSQITSLLQLNTPIDFVFTSEWPEGYFNLLSSSNFPAIDNFRSLGNLIISKIVYSLKPRYHITSGQSTFYERMPYLNEPENTMTRFISLGIVNTLEDKSKKWIHALAVQPYTQIPLETLKGTRATATENPYACLFEPTMTNGGQKRVQFDQEGNKKSNMSIPLEMVTQQIEQAVNANSTNRFYSLPQEEHSNAHNTSTDCWFCLSSSSSEQHLIASVGNYSYLALPKGPLTHDHLLILPLQHTPSMLQLSEEALKEVQRYILAVRDYYRKQGKCLMLSERVITQFNNRNRNNRYNNNSIPRQNHTQYQCIPLDASLSTNVKIALDAAGAGKGIRFQQLDDALSLKESVGSSDYLYSAVYPLDKEEPLRYLYVIENRKPSMQFFRQVALSLLGEDPNKYDWKKVEQTKEEEIKDCTLFKEQFKEFDFTLNEESDQE